MIETYPLHWPEGWKRTPKEQRTGAKFGRNERVVSSFNPQNTYNRKTSLTIAQAIDRVLGELSRLGVRNGDAIISSNLQVRQDGLPRSGQRNPDDPGVSVYWTRKSKGRQECMAVDRYNKVEDNLAAIAATLDSLRSIERHGGGQILDRVFRGFAALAGPDTIAPEPSWWTVLGFESTEAVTLEQARIAYKRLASQHHPDKHGGDDKLMSQINVAWKQAQEELS